jgi:hypothetical protein
MRLLFIILLLIITWLAFKLIIRILALFLLSRNTGFYTVVKDFIAKQAATTRADPQTNQKMVKCVTCKLYIPEDKAYYAEGKYYCCAAHAKNNS